MENRMIKMKSTNVGEPLGEIVRKQNFAEIRLSRETEESKRVRSLPPVFGRTFSSSMDTQSCGLQILDEEIIEIQNFHNFLALINLSRDIFVSEKKKDHTVFSVI